MFSLISSFFFFYFSIIGVYLIFFPKILATLAYSSFEIGLIYSAAPLVRFVVPFVFGRFLALNKKVFYISLANLLLTALLFYVSITSFYLFLLVNVLFGISIGIILPFIESFALKFLQKQNYGKSRLYGSLGFMLVSLVLAQALDFNSANIASYGSHFLLFCIVFTVLFALLIVRGNSEFSSANFAGGGINLFANAYFWIALFLSQVSFGGFYNFFTIYESSHGLDMGMISYLWTFGVLCEIVLFYFQSPLLKYISMQKLLRFAFFVTALRWLLLYLFPSSLYLVFASQSLHAFSFALLHTAAFSYLHASYKNSQLASQFYYGIAYGLGGFVGSLVAGASYGQYLFVVSACFAFMAFLFSLKLSPPSQNC